MWNNGEKPKIEATTIKDIKDAIKLGTKASVSKSFL